MFGSQVPVRPKILVSLVEWSALHNVSVEQVASEAILAYMADVDSGLLTRPRETSRYETRLRART